MRIYLPGSPRDRDEIRAGADRLELRNGRRAWAVTAEALADRPGEDPEDLEYDAVQDAVYASLAGHADPGGGAGSGGADLGGADLGGAGSGGADSGGGADRRGFVLAGDVPAAVVQQATDTGGAYGVVIATAASMVVAAIHVTELGAQAIEEDDTDPALLWFDVSEGVAAVDYCEDLSR